MTIEQAKKLIEENYTMQENTLTLFMHDECEFSADAFWDFYDAIACVTRACVKDEALTAQITVGYQRFLKEIIYHFAPEDIAVMNHFPENYNDYIERLDFAVRAYLENKPEWLEDALYDLQRNDSRNQ